MRLLEIPERLPGRALAAVALLFAAAYTLSLVVIPRPDGRLLIGDALHHYVQLRSAVFDGDLHFRNEYMRMYRLERQGPETAWIFSDLTPTGHVRNFMPVGPAILWAPAFLLVTLGVAIANLAGASYPLDGYGRLFQATAGLTGIAAAAAGVWLSYRACRDLFGARASIWAGLVLWLASSAVYYSLISPTYSHAPSLFATGLFWYAFVRSRERASVSRYLTLGALAGFAALMRWQDAVLMAAVAADLLWRARHGAPAKRTLAWGFAAVATALLLFTPQMYVWQILYGRALAIPQGPGFMRWSEPALVEVMFSTWRGLVTWTPVVAAGLAGLVLLIRRERMLGAAAAVFFCLSWYVNAAAADWWAGEAFGARRFVSCFPVFALGLAALLRAWSPSLKTVASLSAALVIHTLLLLIQYQAYLKGLTDVVPYPKGMYELWLARFVAPFHLWRWWTEG